jgi:hypothetical protein
VRIAGEAVNLVTTGAVGGDLLKAYLLRPGVALREGLASVIADKTTSVVSQVLLLLAGLVVSVFLVPASRTLMLTMAISLVIETVCVASFVMVQLRGRRSNITAPPPALPHRVRPLPLPSRPHLRTPDPRWSRRHSKLLLPILTFGNDMVLWGETYGARTRV